jgi:hypothetical protein
MTVFDRLRHFARLVFVLLCLLIAASGWRSITNGRLGYHNAAGLIVYGPFALAIGTVGALLAIFRWKKMIERKKQNQSSVRWPHGSPPKRHHHETLK